MANTRNSEELFWRSINKIRHGRFICWEFVRKDRKSAYDKDGYGRFSFANASWKTHKLAWMLTNGKIPTGKCVCHKCDNPPCIRPTHLWLGTTQENTADSKQKGRTARGDRNGKRTHPEKIARGSVHPRAVLTKEKAQAIIDYVQSKGGKFHYGRQAIENKFRVSPSTIQRILADTHWTRTNA